MGEVDVVALKEATIDILDGEFLVILGPSGSGKSTLLNLLGGMDRPSSGTVSYDGAMLSEFNDRQLTMYRRHEVGFVFQFYNLLPVLTAYENVELPLLLLPLTKAQRRAQVENALAIVGLSDRMAHRPGQLSGGQQQRVGIARAIVTDPTIIVADEPTGDLDSKSASDVLDLMDLLRSQLGKTIIMVTHDPHAAERAQRLVHLEKGRLVRDGALLAGAH